MRVRVRVRVRVKVRVKVRVRVRKNCPRCIERAEQSIKDRPWYFLLSVVFSSVRCIFFFFYTVPVTWTVTSIDSSCLREPKVRQRYR